MNAERMDSGMKKAVFLGLLVVGSVVIFLLGVMVGSNVNLPPEAFQVAAPERAETGPPEGPAGDEPPSREEVVLPEKEIEVKGEEMTFYDTLSETKRKVPAGKAKPLESPISMKPPVSIEESPAAEEETASPPEEVQAVSAPEEEKPAGEKYYVQILASRNRKAAGEVSDKLGRDGYNTYVVSKETSNGTFYAVRIGRLSTEKEARMIRDRIRGETRYKDAFFRKE